MSKKTQSAVKAPNVSAVQAPKNSATVFVEPPVNENNIDEVEKEIIGKVNHTLSTLEVAIASWDLAEKKPEDLRPKFVKYKKIHELLTEWERRMLLSIGKGDDFTIRVQRLQEFANICYNNA